MYYVTLGYLPIQSAAEDEVDEDYDEVVATNAVETILEPIQMAAEDRTKTVRRSWRRTGWNLSWSLSKVVTKTTKTMRVVTTGVESIVEHDEKPKRCLVM